ncbi:MAG: hypothetical protein COB54_06080 [Alphaproteobacteria bacterium]|nr:MAG: hypothetical protein COB54_06080 [Alphaproteobacteria bacterium]
MLGKVRVADNKNSNICSSPVFAVFQLFKGHHAGLCRQVKCHGIESAWLSCSVWSYYVFYSKGNNVQTDNKFFDDLAKLGQSAVGTLHGVKGEVEAMIRARMEHVLQDMDLVTREEFDVVRDMAKAARAENSELTKKITALEQALKAKKTKSSST